MACAASRSLGHEVKMRPHRDHATGVTIIPDPTQTALSAAVVVAWRIFVKILSVEHDVYLQVAIYRPVHRGSRGEMRGLNPPPAYMGPRAIFTREKPPVNS